MKRGVARKSLPGAGLAVLTIAIVAVGCGSADDPGSSSDVAPGGADAPAPGPGDLVQADGAAGTLVPTPAVVAPGDVLTVRVDNQGHRQLGYGLANRVDRYMAGEWSDVTDEAYEGAGFPAFAQIQLTLKPGELGSLEEIPLSKDLEPGIYRVVKEVFVQGAAVPDRLELQAVFEVRA